MSTVIQATGLTRVFGRGEQRVTALNGVDLSVAAGEFLAVMGPSGCGKSTLLHQLGGLDRPTAGGIRLDGHRLNDMSESALARLRRRSVGFVFQFFNLISNLTVADNVELPGLLAGYASGQVLRRRQELLDALGLSDRANHVPAALSGGEQQRTAIARALVNEPAVLLADEPTGNLDRQSGGEVLRLLRSFNRRGQTIVMVTHDPKVASQAERILFLRDGRIVDETHLGSGNRRAERVLNKLIQLEL
jgi:putative ABC transport system ATP-binding protein